ASPRSASMAATARAVVAAESTMTRDGPICRAMLPASSGKCVHPSTTVSTRASRCARYRSVTASTASPSLQPSSASATNISQATWATRAARHRGVDARIEMREISLRDGIHRLAFAPAFLGERDEYLASDLGDVRILFQPVDGAFIGATTPRVFGGEHRNAAALARLAGRPRPRLDHPDD